MTVLAAERIIVLTAGGMGNQNAVSDFHGFYGADGSNSLAEVGGKLFKNRIADTGRHAFNQTFHDTAGGVLFLHQSF